MAADSPQVSTAQAMRDFDTIRTTIGTPIVAAMFDAPWTLVFLLVAFMLHFWIGIMAIVAAALLVVLVVEPARHPGEDGSRDDSHGGVAKHAAGRRDAGPTVRGLGMIGAMVERQLDSRRIALATWSMPAGRKPADGDQQILPHLRAIGGTRPWRPAGDRRLHLGRGDHRGVNPAQPRAAADRRHHRRLVAAGDRARSDPSLSHVLEGIGGERAYTALPAPKGAIEVENAGVRGNEGRPILVGISFKAGPGKILGIIGPNGSEKSTLGRSIVGAIQPAIGTVRLDGARLTDWDPAELGQNIGYMPQEPSLFEGTIKENISRFARAVTAEDARAIDEAVIAAAADAGVHEMILQLPEAYESRLGRWAPACLSARRNGSRSPGRSMDRRPSSSSTSPMPSSTMPAKRR